jgi:hypothetical protein
MSKPRRSRIRLLAAERAELERRVTARTASQQDACYRVVFPLVWPTVAAGTPKYNSLFTVAMNSTEFEWSRLIHRTPASLNLTHPETTRSLRAG